MPDSRGCHGPSPVASPAFPEAAWTVEGAHSCSFCLLSLQGCCLWQLRADLESRAQELLPAWSCEDLPT